jgi:hypothetical protein
MRNAQKLHAEARKVVEQYRYNRWPALEDDNGDPKWKHTWSFLLAELEGRSPGSTASEYSSALNEAFACTR